MAFAALSKIDLYHVSIKENASIGLRSD